MTQPNMTRRRRNTTQPNTKRGRRRSVTQTQREEGVEEGYDSTQHNEVEKEAYSITQQDEEEEEEYTIMRGRTGRVTHPNTMRRRVPSGAEPHGSTQFFFLLPYCDYLYLRSSTHTVRIGPLYS